ncbi:MAG: ArgE/DapE family deacylase [Anaerolineales bacterium]|nr:ArgE/DapE family deacylase [Anaerolineales bacterium]
MIAIDKTYLAQALSDLVRINSINPGLSKDGAGEAEAAAYIAQAMQALGLETCVQELAPGRANAVGVLRGAGGGRSLMWNAHMDTVGIACMAAPFSGEIRAGKLYGRGSQDMKGSLAAMLAAAKALRQADVRLRGDLVLAAVADEENESIGTSRIIQTHPTDAAIVTEPTDMQLCLAHRGLVYYEVKVSGKAAHGSRYDLGVDSILHMGRFLAQLEKLEIDLRQRPAHPLVGPPSLHASLISGGSEISTYPAECVMQFEWRTIPGQREAECTGEIQAMLERLTAADPRFKGSVRVFQSRVPHQVTPRAQIVQVVENVMQARFGDKPAHAGAPFWTDAALLAEAGIEAVVLGPVGSGLHSEEEWVDLESCADLAQVLAGAALEFCK